MAKNDLDTPAEKPPGFLFKATGLLLGVASMAALVINLIPGVDLFGVSAIIQGAVTVVQFGMDLKTKGLKKASINAGIGALMTAAYLIPFLGAAGRVAGEGAVVALEGAGTGGKVLEEGNFFIKAFHTVKNWIGTAIAKLGELPGIKQVKDFISPKFVKYVKEPLVDAENGVRAWAHGGELTKAGVKTGKTIEKGKEWIQPAAKWVKGNEVAANRIAKGAEAASVVGSVVAEVPPGNLTNSDTYDLNAQNKWTKRIEAERAAQAQQRGAAVPS